jgi:hypothetical protein
MKARKQEELTDGWRADAERRLLNHCQDNGLRFDSVRDFQRRFNIPNVAMNTEIRADMRPAAADDYPSTRARGMTAPEVPPEVPPDDTYDEIIRELLNDARDIEVRPDE